MLDDFACAILARRISFFSVEIKINALSIPSHTEWNFIVNLTFRLLRIRVYSRVANEKKKGTLKYLSFHLRNIHIYTI